MTRGRAFPEGVKAASCVDSGENRFFKSLMCQYCAFEMHRVTKKADVDSSISKSSLLGGLQLDRVFSANG